MDAPKIDSGAKGLQLEESLRNYFLELGYYVARGVCYKYQNIDVTDIDLWLYSRPSSLSRERINVDIKNKRTPQAIERVLWTKGLQQTLNFDKCIVATTDKREAVRSFGKEHNVIILDGSFLSKLSNRKNEYRFTEEEFITLINEGAFGKISGDWKSVLEISKSRLLDQLDYSGCIAWLKDIKTFANEILINKARQQAAGRAFYLTISYFLIGLDFIFKDLSFLDTELREENLQNGFKYGNLGKNGMERSVSLAIKLVNESMEPRSQLWKIINDTYDSIPVDIFKEFFGKNEVSKNLFRAAKELENCAYLKTFVYPKQLPLEFQSIVLVILDFLGIDRKKFLNSFF
jgi:hypothetical protein